MEHLSYQSQDGLAIITLNRPEKLNAFAGSMREDLATLLQSAAGDSKVRVLVITGAGRAFCAGGDVAFMQQLQQRGDTEAFRALLEGGRRIVTLIRSLPKLVIASVNGVAAGAGCNLALACDYRIASDQARFAESFVRIGLNPDWGGTHFLPRLVGTSKAMEIMMSGRIVEAEEALRIGMVDRLVPQDELRTETENLARSIAAGPLGRLADIKHAIYAAAGNDLDQQLQLETENQLRAFASADAAEGMAAFFDKRKPRFE